MAGEMDSASAKLRELELENQRLTLENQQQTLKSSHQTLKNSRLALIVAVLATAVSLVTALVQVELKKWEVKYLEKRRNFVQVSRTAMDMLTAARNADFATEPNQYNTQFIEWNEKYVFPFQDALVALEPFVSAERRADMVRSFQILWDGGEKLTKEHDFLTRRRMLQQLHKVHVEFTNRLFREVFGKERFPADDDPFRPSSESPLKRR